MPACLINAVATTSSSHSLFWEKHFKPETKHVKIVPPKSCENCGTDFRPIKKKENFQGKYKKGEMIFYHGEIDHFPCTLGLTVRNYSNNHLIKAVLKKARTKMVLSVPECAVRRKEEDESTVLPQKYNNQKEKKYPAIIVPQLSAIKIKRSTSNFKVDASTQTKSEQKKRTFSKIRSEFSECLYPFTEIENWVNNCPSECSDISVRSNIKKLKVREATKQEPSVHSQHGFFVGSEWYKNQEDFEYRNPSRPLSPLKWPEKMNSPDYNNVPDYMDIPEQHRLVTIPSRCFNFKQEEVPRNIRTKKTDAPDGYEFNRAAGEYEFNYAPDEYEFNYAPDEYGFNYAPDKHDYNRMVVLPDRMFRFHHNAMQEDYLGDAGGEEELRQSMTKPFLYDDDHPWPDHS